MVSKNKKSSSKKHKAATPKQTTPKQAKQTTPKPATPKRAYLPRKGTLPGRIFQWLDGRPMLFSELSENARRETSLEGDNLASQLSATLHDLRDRGVIVRVDPVTRRILPGKGARGALYSLDAKAQAAYRASRAGMNGAPPSTAAEGEPRQLDLSGFAAAHGARSAAGKPASMTDAVYDTLMAQRAAAEKQVAAIDVLLATWS